MSLLDKQIVSYQGGLTRVKFLIFLLLTLSCSIEDDSVTNNIKPPTSVKAEPLKYEIKVESSEGGTVSTQGGIFEEDSEITITATPNSNYVFIGWEGIDSEESSITINVSGNLNIRALFSQITLYTLIVETSEGGTVSSEGGQYEVNSEIILTAEANDGYVFLGWEGIEQNDNPLSFTINSDTDLRAIFAKVFNLNISTTAGGRVSLTSGQFIQDSELNISAVPNEGYYFSGWEGIDSTELDLTLIIQTDLNLKAIFLPIGLDMILDFETINSILINRCKILTSYKGHNFYVNESSQQYKNDRLIVVYSTNPDLNGWDDNSWVNYYIFRFDINNSIKQIQVYKNLSLEKTFFREEYNFEINMLDSLVEYLDYDYFFRNTKNIIDSEIEDGIYIHSGFSKTINYYQSYNEFYCSTFGKYFYKYDEESDEIGYLFFKIENGKIKNRKLVFPSELSNNLVIWDYENYYFTDIGGLTRKVLTPYTESFDPLTAESFNLNNPIGIIEDDQINNKKLYHLLSKIENPNTLGINFIETYEGVGFYIDEVYKNINFDDPYSYLSAFILDAERHGLDLSYVYDGKIEITVLPDEIWDGSDTTAAYARATCYDDEVEIFYKESAWKEDKIPYKNSFPKSVGVLWHEFGHDILNLAHVCLGNHIMSGRHQDPQIVYSNNDCEEEYITVYGMNWNDIDKRKNFQRAVSDMFNGYEQISKNCLSGKGKQIIY